MEDEVGLLAGKLIFKFRIKSGGMPKNEFFLVVIRFTLQRSSHPLCLFVIDTRSGVCRRKEALKLCRSDCAAQDSILTIALHQEGEELY